MQYINASIDRFSSESRDRGVDVKDVRAVNVVIAGALFNDPLEEKRPAFNAGTLLLLLVFDEDG